MFKLVIKLVKCECALGYFVFERCYPLYQCFEIAHWIFETLKLVEM